MTADLTTVAQESAGSTRVSYTNQVGDLVLVRRAWRTTCCGLATCSCVDRDEDDGWDPDDLDDGWDPDDLDDGDEDAPETEWEFVAVEVIHVVGTDEERKAALDLFHKGPPPPDPANGHRRLALSEQLLAAGIPTRERMGAVA